MSVQSWTTTTLNDALLTGDSNPLIGLSPSLLDRVAASSTITQGGQVASFANEMQVSDIRTALVPKVVITASEKEVADMFAYQPNNNCQDVDQEQRRRDETEDPSSREAKITSPLYKSRRKKSGKIISYRRSFTNGQRCRVQPQ